MAAETSIFSDLSGYVDRVSKLVRLDAALLSLETKENLRSIAISTALFAGRGCDGVSWTNYPDVCSRAASYTIGASSQPFGVIGGGCSFYCRRDFSVCWGRTAQRVDFDAASNARSNHKKSPGLANECAK